LFEAASNAREFSAQAYRRGSESRWRGFLSRDGEADSPTCSCEIGSLRLATRLSRTQFGEASSLPPPLRSWRGADLAPIARSRHSPSTFAVPAALQLTASCKFLLDTQLHKKYSWKIERGDYEPEARAGSDDEAVKQHWKALSGSRGISRFEGTSSLRWNASELQYTCNCRRVSVEDCSSSLEIQPRARLLSRSQLSMK
jgi:hypothetical protein